MSIPRIIILLCSIRGGWRTGSENLKQNPIRVRVCTTNPETAVRFNPVLRGEKRVTECLAWSVG